MYAQAQPNLFSKRTRLWLLGVVKFYNATSSIVRFENKKKYFVQFE
jgi:hypothetical protein